jgi:hypothetical protein
VLEALEAVDAVPLPARCGFWAVHGGVAVEVVARADTAATRRAIERALEAHGVPVRDLRLVADRRQLRRQLPWRCDLREATFETITSESGDPPARLDHPENGAEPALSLAGGVPWS